MKLAVVRETYIDKNRDPSGESQPETRVAVSPDMVRKYINLGFDFLLEAGAGESALFSDQAYQEAGALVDKDRQKILAQADGLLSINGPGEGDIFALKPGSFIVGLLDPHRHKARIEAMNAAGLSALALELIPRISRAQSMDILSSQANLAGYGAVLLALHFYQKLVPMMMTAAGTVAPAKMLVMGAGVAGLQAIATAKRLGAVVSASDVRRAAKEQVESLGGQFVMVDDEETKAAETQAGYAKEMSAAYQEKQKKLIADTIAKQDIVITTALIPGRQAPILITKAMVDTMRPGSVIVDLAVSHGGNVEGVAMGHRLLPNGVHLIGDSQIAGRYAPDASALFARNIYNLIAAFTKEGAVVFDKADEIIKASLLCEGGQILHPQFLGDAS